MKFKQIINPDTEENIYFKKLNKDIKSKWIKIDLNMKDKIKQWFLDNSHHPYTFKSINYWKNIETKKYPPIIIHTYNGKKYIIDGWHRAYVTAILRNENKIKAFVKEGTYFDIN